MSRAHRAAGEEKRVQQMKQSERGMFNHTYKTVDVQAALRKPTGWVFFSPVKWREETCK